METVGLILGGAAGLGGGIALGYALGNRIREKSGAWYWALNAAAMVDGILIMFAGGMLGFPWLSVLGVGFTGGSITGLKYGYGKAMGLWRTHDNLMGIKKPPSEDG